jgi:hypothetical protein
VGRSRLKKSKVSLCDSDNGDNETHVGKQSALSVGSCNVKS